MVRAIKIFKSEKYKKDFLQGDFKSIGIASNVLTPNGFKLYIYLLGNANNFTFKLVPAGFAEWQGDKYSKNGRIIDNNVARKYRDQIKKGIDDLIKNKYLKKVDKDCYEFYESGIIEVKEEKISPF